MTAVDRAVEGAVERAPWLHVITSDDVIATSGFVARAREVISALGPAGVFHLRCRNLSSRDYVVLAQRLLDTSRGSGALLTVNGRVDVALAAGVDAVQLGRGAIGAVDVRRIAPSLRIGLSVHSPEAAAHAHGADWLLFGNVFATASHPDSPGAGLARLRQAAAATATPVVAIGGVTIGNVASIFDAGAAAVAVLSGIWYTEDAKAATLSYLCVDADRRCR